MAQVLVVAVGEFRVGRILNRALQLLLKDFAKFILIAFVATVPGLALYGAGLLLSYNPPLPAPPGSPFVSVAESLIASLPFCTLSEAVTLHSALKAMRGDPFRLREAFACGFTRFFPLLGVGLACLIVPGFLLLLVPAFILAAHLYPLLSVSLVVLIVPVFTLATHLYVALPACMMEGLRSLESLRRSGNLTKGHRWKLLGLYLLSVIVSAAVFPVIVTVLRAIGLTAAGLAGLAWITLFTAYGWIVVAVVYHDLRGLKDGIAAVFD